MSSSKIEKNRNVKINKNVKKKKIVTIIMESDSEDEVATASVATASVATASVATASVGEIKRNLTTEEMFEVSDFLQIDENMDWETSIAVMEENRKDLFDQMKDIKIYPSKIPKLKIMLKKYYETSKIEPGTAVGCDSSLGIGEPTTQMSLPKDIKVQVRRQGNIFSTTIGEFIDSEITKSWMVVEKNKSYIVPKDAFEYTEILSVSKNEQVSWKRITELSKHPVNGELVEITTSTGKKTTCTLSHSFLSRDCNGVVKVRGSDIKEGMWVPTLKCENQSSTIPSVVPSVVPVLNKIINKLNLSEGNIPESTVIQKLDIQKYISFFTKHDIQNEVSEYIQLLYQAQNGEVVWEKITQVHRFLPDQNDSVYDFSVDENETFATLSGIFVHNTLNTFHLAGVSSANVTLGVPRTNEILDASKNQKTNVLSLSLLPSVVDLTNLQMVRDKCRVMFEERYVDQCILEHEVLQRRYDSLPPEEEIWYNFFDNFYSTSYKNCEWCIRLKLNKLVMFQYKLTCEKISKRIETEYKDCRCVFSPDYIGIVDIYIDTSNVDVPSVILETRKKGRKRDEEKDEKENKTLITETNKDFYFVSRVAVDYIMDIKLSGVEGITKVYYQLDNKTKTWKIETAGTNMREVMNNPDVDFRQVVSNNMWEIFGILGIEAARKFLVSEISATISFGGTFIDPVHPALLADSMTSTGTITSVNRYGISKSVVGVFTPASFEQSHQNMLDAPAKGVTDDCSTVSAGIILAKHVKIGTGYFGLMTDRKKIRGMNIPQNSHRVLKTIDDEKCEEKGLNEQNVNIRVPGMDSRFPTSVAVFKSGGKGLVVEKLVNDKLVNDKLVNDKLVNDKLVNDKLVNDKLVNDKLEEKREYVDF
jgi:DNA-directed RNA polymerase beta' subunit